MKKYITKKNIIILCSILIILFCLILHFTQQNKISDLPEGNRIDSAFKNINMKDVCKINYVGYNENANASLECKIPELEERKEKIIKKYEENRENYVLNYSEKLKQETTEKILKILELDNNSICSINKSEKISNNDVLIVQCNVEELKYLNYNIVNKKYEIKVEGLESEPEEEPIVEIPEEPMFEDTVKEDQARFYEDLGESVIVFPANPSKYNFNQINEKEIFLQVDYKDFEQSKEIAKKEERIKGIIVENFIFFRTDGFSKEHEYYGFANGE